ncbi:hypothetical protein ACMAZH_00375 [Arenicellales bacterium nBUS_45]
MAFTDNDAGFKVAEASRRQDFFGTLDNALLFHGSVIRLWATG